MNARRDYKREWRRQRRLDPEYQAKERDAARARRLDPVVRERERQAALEYMRQVRSTDAGKTLIRERNRARTRRQNGIPEPTRPAPVVCECCGRSPDPRLLIDHDHITGAFRGWLCNRCNLGLGYFGDSIDGIDRAKTYLLRALLT